jgi:mono/diheme cytochrome c family protein
MPKIHHAIPAGLVVACLAGVLSGCQTPLPKDNPEGTRVSSTSFVKGPAPLRMPSPDQAEGSARFEDSLTGGEVFQMYCSQCHNRRPMSERGLLPVFWSSASGSSLQ